MLQCVLQLIFQNVFLSSMETAWRTSFHNTVVIVRCCSVCCSWYFRICFSALWRLHDAPAFMTLLSLSVVAVCVAADILEYVSQLTTRLHDALAVTTELEGHRNELSREAASLRRRSGDSFIRVTWLIDMCAVTHSNVVRDLFLCRGTPRWIVCIELSVLCSCVWHDSFICVTGLVFESRNTAMNCHVKLLSCVAAQVKRVTWLINTCDMTLSYVWHDSFIRVTWLIDICAVTHWYVCRDSFICVT
jgi:hypothetical protein